MTTITATTGDSIDTSAIPEASLNALVLAGLNHTLGNVVASKIVSDIRKTINEKAPSEVTTEAIKAWRKGNEEAVSKLSAGYRAELLKAIAEGNLGTRTASGPRASADPLLAEMQKIAKEQVTARLGAVELKFPGFSGKGEDRVADTVTLKGVAYTGAELIAIRLDPARPHREEIEKEAKARLAARKRMMEKEAAKGVDDLV